MLRRLLRQGGRHCAALAVEEPRWHVVLETCAEMLGTAELGEALLWCESRRLKVGAGARVLVPFLALDFAVDRRLIALDVGGGDLDKADARRLCEGLATNDVLQELTLRKVTLPVQQLRTSAEVDLSDQGLVAHDGIALSALLGVNTALTSIDVLGAIENLERPNPLLADAVTAR